MNVLVAYGSKKGSTQEVAEVVADTLRDAGLEVDFRQASEVDDVDGYAGVVLGGSIYFGRWHRDAFAFLERNRRVLADIPVAVFALGPMDDEPDQLADSRNQLDRWLAKVPGVEPVSVAVFGGVIDPGKLRFPLSRIPASDARDWGAIDAWAKALVSLLGRHANVAVPG